MIIIVMDDYKLWFVFLFVSNLLFFGTFRKSVAQEAGYGSKKISQYSIAERDSLFLLALSVLPDHNIPIEYRFQIPEYPPIRCATMILAEVRQNLDIFSAEQKAVLNKLLQRPGPDVLPLTFISSSGRFKIHYTDTSTNAVPIADINNNSVPDFVDEVASAFEKSYQIQIDVLEYQEPPDDNGVDGEEYDIYILDVGAGSLYGETVSELDVPETPQDDFTSFIRIDNDYTQHFTRGVPGAQVTAAHEYFHAIQFGYRSFLNNDEKFYYELCSVWMEDVIYDDINDYYQYLPTFFRRTQTPFNEFDVFGHYLGEALWNHFLVKTYDDSSMIRLSWEFMKDGSTAMEAIDQSLREIGGSFDQDFVDFARWNYFTGSRADSINFHDESGAYPEIRINEEREINSNISIDDSSKSLTHKYFKITTLLSSEYSISGSVEEPSNWMFGALTTTPSSEQKFHVFRPFIGQNLGFLPSLSEIVVIPVNLKILNDNNINSTVLSFNFTIEPRQLDIPVEKGITEIYPNPFKTARHPEVSFIFFGTENEDIEVRIFSADGRVIKTDNLTDKNFYSWDGKSDKGEIVSSGIYLIQVKQGNFRDIKKFAVIRK